MLYTDVFIMSLLAASWKQVNISILSAALYLIVQVLLLVKSIQTGIQIYFCRRNLFEAVK